MDGGGDTLFLLLALLHTLDHRYDTDGVVSEAMRTDTRNYSPFFGTEENSRLQRGSLAFNAETRNFTRPPNFRGFYLAFRDTGTCVNVARIILYYRVARGSADAFTRCPDVPLPIAGSGQVSSLMCTCLGNTSEVSGSLERSCDEDGVCTEGQRCECVAGFQFNATETTCVGKSLLLCLRVSLMDYSGTQIMWTPWNAKTFLFSTLVYKVSV